MLQLTHLCCRSFMTRIHPIQVIFLILCVLTPVLFWVAQNKAAGSVYIKESSFTNNDKQDWVDLYNPTLNSISLKGYFLSDDIDDPTKWQFTSGWIIESHDTLRVFGKSSDTAPFGSAILNFNLGNGETLVLTAPDGKRQLDRMTLLAPPGYKGLFTMGRPTSDPGITEVFYQNSALSQN